MTMSNDEQLFWQEWRQELRGTMRDCTDFGRGDLLKACEELKAKADAGSIQYEDAQLELNGYLRDLHPPISQDS